MKDSRPKKVGRKQRFNADDVVKAALEIGVHTFTMNDIASEIGVAAPAVYRIFSGRQEVVEVAIQRALKEFDPVEGGLNYQATLNVFHERLNKLLDKYEGLAYELVGDPRLALWGAPAFEAAISNVMADGFDQDTAAFLVAYVAGQTCQLHITYTDGPESVDEDASARFERDTPLTAHFVEGLLERRDDYKTPRFLTVLLEWAANYRQG